MQKVLISVLCDRTQFLNSPVELDRKLGKQAFSQEVCLCQCPLSHNWDSHYSYILLFLYLFIQSQSATLPFTQLLTANR